MSFIIILMFICVFSWFLIALAILISKEQKEALKSLIRHQERVIEILVKQKENEKEGKKILKSIKRHILKNKNLLLKK